MSHHLGEKVEEEVTGSIEEDIEEEDVKRLFMMIIMRIKKEFHSTRPPAEKWVKSASEFGVNSAYQVFRKQGLNTEYLIGYEGNSFAYTGNMEEDLLSIVSVHPTRKALPPIFKTTNSTKIFVT
jgi:wyosine [tRNA(Phe)-imidazoG37] synthetase (radical SAM superfamily)